MLSFSERTHKSAAPAVILSFLLTTLLLAGAVFLLCGRGKTAATLPSGAEVEGEGLPPITCVVIDAGHGGEDGGASSAAGLVEKDVNLAVALTLRDQLEAAGVPCVLTRSEDKLLYDRSVDYHGRKKVLDLAARHAIGEATPGCLFVSIHMNAFSSARESGMQVWYGVADPRSEAVAAKIQAGSLALTPDNRRKCHAAGSNIYLLDRASCPAVLVECGFLSNPAEAAKLGEADYRDAVATVIMAAILPFVSPGD